MELHIQKKQNFLYININIQLVIQRTSQNLDKKGCTHDMGTII